MSMSKNSYERPPAQTIPSKQVVLRVHVDSQNFTSNGFFANANHSKEPS